MVFVGYCGWMSGQLNAEVAANGWTVAAASAANTLALVNASARAGDVMGESMWATMRGRLGYPRPGNLGYDTPNFGAEGPLCDVATAAVGVLAFGAETRRPILRGPPTRAPM